MATPFTTIYNRFLGKVTDDTPESNGEWNADNTEYTYHGLHYNANTRTVSFKVDNLQAGCVLTVGVITRTPASVNGRVDFYNYGTARDEETTVKFLFSISTGFKSFDFSVSAFM